MFKYLVLKNKDLKDSLLPSREAELDVILTCYEEHRSHQGKKDNVYLVLNTDESYSNEVFALMFKHGHTPCNDCQRANPKTCGEEKCPWLPILISSYPLIFNSLGQDF